MNLRQYLDTHGIVPAEFARRLGVAGNTLSQWCTGSRMPEPAALLAIERETHGRVTATDMAMANVAYRAGIEDGTATPRPRGRPRKHPAPDAAERAA